LERPNNNTSGQEFGVIAQFSIYKYHRKKWPWCPADPKTWKGQLVWRGLKENKRRAKKIHQFIQLKLWDLSWNNWRLTWC